MEINAKYKMVYIKWRDAYSSGGKSWHELQKDVDSPGTCVSIGFLVADNEQVKVIYPHIALEDDFTNEAGQGNMVIPTSAIIAMKELKIKGR